MVLSVRWPFLIGGLMLLMACSPSAPIPSPLFDGHYVGSRQSDSADACGTDKPVGPANAQVNQGQVSMHLFGPQNEIAGTVGSSGQIRASGMQQSNGHFPRMVIFTGQVEDGRLEGQATNFSCRTEVHLHKAPERVLLAPSPPPPSHSHQRKTRPRRHPHPQAKRIA